MIKPQIISHKRTQVRAARGAHTHRRRAYLRRTKTYKRRRHRLIYLRRGAQRRRLITQNNTTACSYKSNIGIRRKPISHGFLALYIKAVE